MRTIEDEICKHCGRTWSGHAGPEAYCAFQSDNFFLPELLHDEYACLRCGDEFGDHYSRRWCGYPGGDQFTYNEKIVICDGTIKECKIKCCHRNPHYFEDNKCTLTCYPNLKESVQPSVQPSVLCIDWINPDEYKLDDDLFTI